MEEVLLKNTTDDFIFLYINSPSVVTGKHQVAYAEMNFRFLHENNIPVIRRISGGGTVYHDYGNINYSFIINGAKENLIDFKKYTSPVTGFLNKLHLEANLEGKSNLRMNGLKFSGNAAHLFKNRVLHHGTILFNSDLNKLSAALKISTGLYEHNGVPSARTEIFNLSQVLKLNKEKFIAGFKEYLFYDFKDLKDFQIEESLIDLAESLAEKKYRTFEWNIGYSPAYSFTNKPDGIYMEVKHGIIANCRFDGITGKKVSDNFLNGVTHEFSAIRKKLQFVFDVVELNSMVYKFF